MRILLESHIGRCLNIIKCFASFCDYFCVVLLVSLNTIIAKSLQIAKVSIQVQTAICVIASSICCRLQKNRRNLIKRCSAGAIGGNELNVAETIATTPIREKRYV